MINVLGDDGGGAAAVVAVAVVLSTAHVANVTGREQSSRFSLFFLLIVGSNGVEEPLFSFDDDQVDYLGKMQVCAGCGDGVCVLTQAGGVSECLVRWLSCNTHAGWLAGWQTLRTSNDR